MTPSDELFQLIKSLTPSEKRYFKIHASKHVIGKSNHYEKLFDALDVLPDDKPYDEAAFKKSLRGKSYGTHLSDEKSHLREMILRAMRVYHAERTPKGQLVEMIHEISFLYSKGLVKSCQQTIDKAMKLAEETEQFPEMLVLNDFLLRLYKKAQTESPLSVVEIEHRERDVLEKIAVTRQALYLRLKMDDIHLSSMWKEREAEAKVYMDTATKLATKDDLSMQAIVSLLNTRQRYLIQHHRYKEGLDITAQWIERAERADNVFDQMNDRYRTALSNYMMCAMHCEKFELLPPAIAKLKGLKTDNEMEEADAFRQSTQFELIHLLNSGDSSDPSDIFRSIEQGIKKHKRFIPKEQAVNFRFNIALLLFLRKDYLHSLHHINILHELSGRDRYYDHIMIMARTMEWICHSATGNYEILDSSLRSLRRYADERKIKHTFFDLMFRLFDQIIKAGNKRSVATATVEASIRTLPIPPEWDQLKGILLAWL